VTIAFAHTDSPALAGATAPVAARRRLLLGLAMGLSAVDAIWSVVAHLDVAYGAYLPVIGLALALFAGSNVYQTRRPDPRLSAMLFGAGFLCLFSATASVLNYCLLTVAGAPIDLKLAALDRAIGFDWPAAMTAVSRMPLFNAILYVAYATMLPQVALLTVVLARRDTFPDIYRFCLAVAVGALVCIAVWTIAPSFGAIAVYDVPSGWHLPLALDKGYARELAALLAHGPGRISPDEVRGLIGFPSYHAVLALLVAFYAWRAPWLRWPALVLNLLVVVATPIQGGHHLVDVLAGVPVAALALYGAGEFRQRTAV
jgi:hypothetical protein